MVIGCRIRPYLGEPWGFDNGAFRDWRAGKAFDAESYQFRLAMAQRIGIPYMAVCPDIVAGGLQSLEFSLSWRKRLPDDFPWYLAVQDGMSQEDVIPVLDQFSGIFLGGTNRFKATALHWCELAHQHGKLFHYARAGTRQKLDHARMIGADSVDSAFPLWVQSRFEQFSAAMNESQCSFFDPVDISLDPKRFCV